MDNNKQQRLDKLTTEYNDLNGKISRLDAFLNRLDFETTVPDTQEQMLMQHQLQAMRSYRTNLKERIQLLQVQIKSEESIKDWSQYKNTDSAYIGVDVSDEGDHGACCQECVDDLLHRATAKFKELIAETDAPECNQLASMLKNFYALRHGIKEAINTDEQHHCGQDVRVQYDPNESQPVNVPVRGDDCDDACCQAREKRPVGDGPAVVEKPIITGESLQQLVGYQVIAVCKPGSKCNGCPYDHYKAPCIKVEIVGGFFLCMEPLTNSIVTE